MNKVNFNKCYRRGRKGSFNSYQKNTFTVTVRFGKYALATLCNLGQRKRSVVSLRGLRQRW